MNEREDQNRSPATRPGEAQAEAKREERDAIASAVEALEGTPSERPEALAQFAESAREGEDSPKPLTADDETKPRPTSNRDKHEVATRLLNEGADGEQPDPHAEGVDRLPDRIIDRG